MKQLVRTWFRTWEEGSYTELPLTDNFRHTSPFGTIEGKSAYMKLVKENEDNFIGYEFELLDEMYEKDRACVRYTARQGEDFALDVSEWYYPKDGMIERIVSYYHIGEIRADRELRGGDY